MNPKQFLMIGGVILLLVGIVGFFGIIGPTPDQSIFGDAWYFDNGENWAHTILGVVALILAFASSGSTQKWVVVLLGVIGIVVGVYSIFNSNFLGSALQNPADTLLHIVIGIWALLAAFMGGKSMEKKAA
jgi:uncharacterized membrane protein HdeD (DUF308 family)